MRKWHKLSLQKNKSSRKVCEVGRTNEHTYYGSIWLAFNQAMDPPKRDAWPFEQHPVVPGYLLVQVRQQGNVDMAKTSRLLK